LCEGYLLSLLCEIRNEQKLRTFLLGAGIRKYAHTEVLPLVHTGFSSEENLFSRQEIRRGDLSAIGIGETQLKFDSSLAISKGAAELSPLWFMDGHACFQGEKPGLGFNDPLANESVLVSKEVLSCWHTGTDSFENCDYASRLYVEGDWCSKT
jgi:hypothetical protein